jgi:hypothetical protein
VKSKLEKYYELINEQDKLSDKNANEIYTLEKIIEKINKLYSNEITKRDAEICDLLIEMPYREYLKTIRWNSLRNNALRKQGHKCQLCSSNKNLNVRHRSYERMNTADEFNDLIVLCKNCHAKFHDKLGDLKKNDEKKNRNLRNNTRKIIS